MTGSRGGMIAGGVFLVLMLGTAFASGFGFGSRQGPAVGRYAVATNAEGRIAWRVDTATGHVSWCVMMKPETGPECGAWGNAMIGTDKRTQDLLKALPK